MIHSFAIAAVTKKTPTRRLKTTEIYCLIARNPEVEIRVSVVMFHGGSKGQSLLFFSSSFWCFPAISGIPWPIGHSSLCLYFHMASFSVCLCASKASSPFNVTNGLDLGPIPIQYDLNLSNHNC